MFYPVGRVYIGRGWLYEERAKVGAAAGGGRLERRQETVGTSFRGSLPSTSTLPSTRSTESHLRESGGEHPLILWKTGKLRPS